MGMHIGQLPFDRNRLFVVALFRVLCHHERASLPGNTWSLTPTMAKEALFLILKLLQIPQDATPAFGNAGHTQVITKDSSGRVAIVRRQLSQSAIGTDNAIPDQHEA